MKSSILLFSIIGLMIISDINPAFAVNIDTSVVIKKTYRLSLDSLSWDVVNMQTFEYNPFAYITIHYGSGNEIYYTRNCFVGEDTMYYDKFNRVIEKRERYNIKEYNITKNEYYTDNRLKDTWRWHYYDDNSIPSSCWRNSYIYDNSHIIYENCYDSDTLDADPRFRYFYRYINNSYDQFDVVTQFKINGVWQDSSKITYKYSKTGKILYIKDNIYESFYEYNAADSLIHSLHVFLRANVYNSENNYRYNTEGKLIYEDHTDPIGFTKKEYFYKNNKLDSLEDLSIRDYSWNVYTSTKYVYKDDLLIQERQSIYDVHYWGETYKFGIIDYEYKKITDIHEEKNEIDQFIISPNPATDFIEINIPVGVQLAVPMQVEIYDIMGERIQTTPSTSLPPLQTEGEFKINISGFVPGIYFVKIGERVQRFVKL